jgi:uncharacterized small protein (TIGR04563 family)
VYHLTATFDWRGTRSAQVECVCGGHKGAPVGVVNSSHLAMAHVNAGTPHCRSEDTVSMSGTDKRKQSLYFPESMLQDIQKEAARLDRSLSWIVQRCVKLGLPDIRKLPSVNEIPDDDVAGPSM